MMPCRISVYENMTENLYFKNEFKYYAKRFCGIIEEVMTSSANEVEEILESLAR